MSKKIKIYSSIIVLLTMLVLVVSVQPAKAQFVLAWDYYDIDDSGLDEYGQGLYMYIVMENVTNPSYWVAVGGTWYFNETTSFEWEVGAGIKLRIYNWLNSTLTGATNLTDGLTYQRMNVTVELLGVELESHDDIDNFYSSSFFDPIMWLYGFEVVLNIIPEEGYTYSVTITYEVYW